MARFGAILPSEQLFLYSQLVTGPTLVAQLSRLSPLWFCPSGLRLHIYKNPLYFQVVTACAMGILLHSPHLLAGKTSPNNHTWVFETL